METILHSGWGVTIILILLFMAALVVAAFILAEYGKKYSDQAKEYETKYVKIEKLLDQASVNEQNYDWMVRLFDSLKALPYKDKEKNEVLENKFRRKFSEVIDKRKKELI